MEQADKPVRENGFYWVRDTVEWVIAEWHGDSIPCLSRWMLTSTDERFYDDEFQEIDELRIVRNSS
jgi:hypothetical protein